MTNEITLVTRLGELEVAPEQSKTLLDGFGNLFIEAHKLVAKAKGIKVTSEDQVEEMAEAKSLRIKLMKVRTEAEKIKKAIKEPYLRGAQASQDIYNDIRDITKPEEERLMEQEKFAELAEAKRVEERHTKRVEKLSLYVADVSVYTLREMDDVTFDGLVIDCKTVFDAKIDASKREEKAKIDQEKKEKLYHDRKIILAPYSDFTDISKLTVETNVTDYEEIVSLAQVSKNTYEENQEKIRLENEKLKKEADEKIAKEAIEAKKRADADKKIKDENDEKIRLANVAREDAEDKLKKSKELEEARLLEEKQEADRKVRLEEDEAKKKLLAPDKDKLIDLATAIDMIKFPAVESSQAGEIIREAVKMIDLVSRFIREKAKGL